VKKLVLAIALSALCGCALMEPPKFTPKSGADLPRPCGCGPGMSSCCNSDPDKGPCCTPTDCRCREITKK